jgi:hypothetical protein
MSQAPASMTVFIPLTIRKRNGRPKIMPPADMAPETGGVDPHILKAIAKAWSWRRKLESGQSATIEDIAQSESVTPAFIRRMLKLSYLAPVVLEKILIARVSPEVSLKRMSTAADLPWVKQEVVIFANEENTCDAASGEAKSPSAKTFPSPAPQVQ